MTAMLLRFVASDGDLAARAASFSRVSAGGLGAQDFAAFAAKSRRALTDPVSVSSAHSSAVQPSAGAAINSEPGACDFCRALEIEDTQLFADVPMVFRRKIERRRVAPAPHFAIFRFVAADFDAGVRQIG